MGRLFFFGVLSVFLEFDLSLAWGAGPLRIHHGNVMVDYEIAKGEVFNLVRKRVVEPPGFELLRGGGRQLAVELEVLTGEWHDVVLYPVGKGREEHSRRVVLRKVLVHVEAGTSAEAIAHNHNVNCGKVMPFAPGWRVLEVRLPGQALELANALRKEEGVLYAEPMLGRLRERKIFPNDPLFPDQWHLYNTGQLGATPGIDLNVADVWDEFRGEGILVAVVDDSLDYTHEDLVGRVNTLLDYDYRDEDDDPKPEGGTGFDSFGLPNRDSHGTAVSGLLGGSGNNSKGGIGVAYESTLVGIRLIGSLVSDLSEAMAISHSNDVIHISNNSWGEIDDGLTKGGPEPLARMAMEHSARHGRGGKGAILVWAAGNGAMELDTANYDTYVNSIYSLAVAATDDRGVSVDYSEIGSCLVISAPAGGGLDRPQALTTTDLEGADMGYNQSSLIVGPVFPEEISDRKYSQGFLGTSAATPLVSGVVALMLQANPNLGWRDVQEVMIRTATRTFPDLDGWATNAAGLTFHHHYGSGLVNAKAAVEMSRDWNNLSPQRSLVMRQDGLGIPIPDSDLDGVTVEFDLTDSRLVVEHAVLRVGITHSYRGDLAILLESPEGMLSILAFPSFDFNPDYIEFPLMSVFNWGESSHGIWKVIVVDDGIGDLGTVNSLELELFGQHIDAIPPKVSLVHDLDGTVRLEVQGYSGVTYGVDESSDMVNWNPVLSLPATSAEFDVVVGNSNVDPMGFYRVSAPGVPLP